MEILEAEPAQIEHINQIIYNNQQHDSWDCFDTALVLEQYPRYGVYDNYSPKDSVLTQKVVDLRYNSMIVNITHETDTTIYEFEVRNTLWDGTYQICHSKSSPEDETVYFNKDEIFVGVPNPQGNKIIFSVTGQHRKQVRICFHMNIAGDGRNIKGSTILIDHPSEFTHQFDEIVNEVGYIKSGTGTKISGATITLKPCDSKGIEIDKGIPAQTIPAKDQKNGQFTMPYGKTSSPGDYYCILHAEYKSAETTQIVHIKKIQKHKVEVEWKPLPKEASADWGDENQYKDVIKGSIKTFKIEINIKNEFGTINNDKEYLEGAYATVTFKKITGGTISQTCKFDKEGDTYYINPKISYRGYYEDSSILQVSIPSQNGYPAITKERLVKHSWKIVDNFTDLKNEINNPEGADWVFLESKGPAYTVNETLKLNPRNDGSKITIAALLGNYKSKLQGNNNFPIIEINNPNAATDNYFKVQLIGLSFLNGNPAIKMSTGCRLLVDNCYFNGNTNHALNHRGCSIFMPSTDETKASNKLWKLEVRNSMFYNNRGNEIQSIGITKIHHNLFRTDRADCLQQPEVKVVSVRAGEVEYAYNKSHIKVTQALVSNHSYAKALAYIDKTGKFNGVGPSQLGWNNALPLYRDYHNQAYTYAIYYYPYSNVRTTIVCSPERGKERQATGHSSSIKNWVYYDGYYFIRRSAGKGNTYDPWTKEELEVPYNQGIYDNDKGFKIGYDPRLSGNKSLNSELD